MSLGNYQKRMEAEAPKRLGQVNDNLQVAIQETEEKVEMMKKNKTKEEMVAEINKGIASKITKGLFKPQSAKPGTRTKSLFASVG